MSKNKRTYGHYCKICGQHKANEKFSGAGHANHICKVCAKLPAAEKSEVQTMNRLLNLPIRRLTDSERKWLENRVHDSRPEISELAHSVYNMIFPHAERKSMKKQLVISNLTFEVHSEIYDFYGDAEQVNRRFAVDRKTCMLAYVDLVDEQEQTVILTQDKMYKLLKWMVHSLKVFMCEKDNYGNFYLNYVDLVCLDDELGDESLYFIKSLSLPVEHADELPAWSIHVEYSNHTV